MRALKVGERFRFIDEPAIWIVRRISEASATVERELVSARRVDIKNDAGEIVRSFFAHTSGDRQNISPCSIVHRLPENSS